MAAVLAGHPERYEELVERYQGRVVNYLYRVLPALQKDGLVRKDGRGWYPVEAA